MRASHKRPRKKPTPFAGTESFVRVGDWLRFAVTLFSRADLAFAQGLHDAQEEAVFLIARHLGLEPVDLPQFLQARLTPDEIAEIRELIRRRFEERVPVPYLVNEAWQAGHRFVVDERVLIPRSYIAELIPDQLAAFAGGGKTFRRILELGTGSGALAIIAAHAFPEASVDAVDISLDALEVAAENVALHHLDERVNLMHSDLFDAVPAGGYDLIIANPPYEPLDVVESIPPELAHEPRLALLGGDDGMELVRRIMRDARAHLADDGILVLELGELRSQLEREFPAARPHIFTLADGSDAVLGFHAADLP